MVSKVLSIIILSLLLVGCSSSSVEKRVNKQLKKMTLDEKIGQMLVIYYTSVAYKDALDSAIKNVKPGGFILFKDNIVRVDQLMNFISQIQEKSKIPMFIAIDQEGGIVQRLNNLQEGVTTIPTMQKIGETNDEDLAYQVGEIIAKELNVFGINMNFAPVLDININPDNTVIGSRAFGNNPEIVSKMGLAVAKGMKANRVIPVYKHFPGYGDTAEHPDYGLPVLNKTKEELFELELKPFIEAINNGADIIMVGHIAVPKLTNDNTPASFSKTVINDLLRKELGFKGVVITDALNMGAVTKMYTRKEIIVNAINAGVDLLLMPGPSKTTVEIIKEAIKNGEISEMQIEEAAKRILTLKYKAGLFGKKKLNDKSILGSLKHQEIIKQISN
jgi:beta-N-acetylhexosaminidase